MNLERMRTITIIFLVFVSLQFWLGMTINLELFLPIKYLSAVPSLIYYMSHYGFILVHVIDGFSLLLLTLLFLYFAFKEHYLSLKVISIVATSSVIGAIINGILFLMSGQFFGYSIGMAMSAISALITFAVGLYYIGFNIGRVNS
ncbi:MAG: hypothetical protein QXQ25_05520 [Thermoplasmata archaeon]